MCHHHHSLVQFVARCVPKRFPGDNGICVPIRGYKPHPSFLSSRPEIVSNKSLGGLCKCALVRLARIALLRLEYREGPFSLA